jgi:hypothetical protein
MQTTSGLRTTPLLALLLAAAVGPGCGSGDDDDDDDADDSDAGDAGDSILVDAPAFAGADVECPPTGALTRPAAARVRPSLPVRSIVARAPRSAASPAPTASLAEAGRWYLRRAYPRGLAAPAELHTVHDRGGAIVLKYRQRVGGVDVFRKELNLVLARDRKLVATSGELASSQVAAPVAATGDPASLDRDARAAVVAAARDLGVSLAPAELSAAGTRPPYIAYRPPRGHALATARARRTYYDDGAALVPALYVEMSGRFRGSRTPELRSAVVGAGGDILFRNDKTSRAEPFSYRVYAEAKSLEPSISPFCDQGVPHPTGTLDGYVPAEPCAQELVSLIESGTPTEDPWLADDATETSGNNVDSFFHIQTGAKGEFFPPDYAPANGDFRAQATGARQFDYPYDVALAPGDFFEDDEDETAVPDPADPQLNAKVVHGFYLGNYLHDLLYVHGYDEASGNSQADNYGRGGLGGDPLLVQAGSFSTYTLPTADGEPSVLTMGLNAYSQLRRDSTLDLMIFAHEWMHTMQHRLIGDSEGLSTSQAGALGEGWSDFLGLLVATRPDQAQAPANPDWQGAFGLGPYHNQAYCDDFPAPFGTPCDGGPDQAYYFGIRRYPFTVDKSKSPLTFRHIANRLELPDEIPHFFWKLRIENAEIHSAGEIWASALWGCYRGLLVNDKYTFDEAQGRMLDYVVGGMKATPIDPTFLEARDAFLAVAQATDEEDYQVCRQAFADRGMGAGAVAPPRGSGDFRGAIESLRASGPALSFISATVTDGAGGDGDGLLDVGEEGTLTVVLRNTGFDDLADTTVHAEAATAGVDVTDSDQVRSSSPGEDIAIEFPIALNQADHYQLVQVEVTFGDDDAALDPTRVSLAFHVHHDLARTRSVDPAESAITQADWFMNPDLPYSETVWARVPQGDQHAYQLAGTRIDRSAGLVSPCVLASADEDLVVRFQHAYQLDVYGAVEVRTAGTDEFAWQPAYSLPLGSSTGEEVEVNLGRTYAGQWLQIRFWGYAPPAVGEEVPSWTVDDIELAGIDNTPFTEILPDGTAP